MGLPASAVPPGFILSAVNIASANGFFDDQPNTNVNSVSQGELEALLQEWTSLDQDGAEFIADLILEERRWPNNGIADSAALVEAVRGNTSETERNEIDSVLSMDYREADDWSAIRRPEI